MPGWTTSKKFKGLQWSEHPTRKHGGKPDRYFRIRYQLIGVTKTEGLGWASAGWNEEKAGNLLAEIKQNLLSGGPVTYKEMKQQAEDERIKREEELEKNKTIQEIFESDYQIHSNRTKESNNSVNSTFKKWVNPIIGDKRLNEVTFTDLLKIKGICIKAELAPATISRVFNLINHIYDICINFDIYDGANPVNMAKLKLPAIQNERNRFLSKDEAEILLNETKGYSENLYEISLTSLHSGFRLNEVLKLKWSDIDLEHKMITARDRKNKESSTIPMSDDLYEMLSAKERKGRNEFVFRKDNENSKSQISKLFRLAVEDVALNENVDDPRQRVVFHTLRHTFCSWLVQAGVPLKFVSKLAGHKSIRMTERYAHLAPENFEIVRNVFSKSPTQEKPKPKLTIVK
ncbi:tyrosine-type recombinase/integrase [Fundidesulfovibrio putealis]|uniref:tyrosine-type recombinase/integrase n=1 Tax=Fundidesulfovibrio putealis TaxID=270496 RepID=UPI000416CB75|nr:site-specific integrase [Fundidesulfovibrio putealis]